MYMPLGLFGIGTLAKWVLPVVPLLRWLAFTCVATFRPLSGLRTAQDPSLSIIVPARNEEGNIADCLRRLPDFPGVPVEVIFVEGNSSDGTWPAIQRAVADSAGGSVRVRAYRQPGRGKQDAVRLGIQKATNDLVTILDADLTMPPEMLVRFYTRLSRRSRGFHQWAQANVPDGKGCDAFPELAGKHLFRQVG